MDDAVILVVQAVFQLRYRASARRSHVTQRKGHGPTDLVVLVILERLPQGPHHRLGGRGSQASESDSGLPALDRVLSLEPLEVPGNFVVGSFIVGACGQTYPRQGEEGSQGEKPYAI